MRFSLLITMLFLQVISSLHEGEVGLQKSSFICLTEQFSAEETMEANESEKISESDFFEQTYEVNCISIQKGIFAACMPTSVHSMLLSIPAIPPELV